MVIEMTERETRGTIGRTEAICSARARALIREEANLFPGWSPSTLVGIPGGQNGGSVAQLGSTKPLVVVRRISLEASEVVGNAATASAFSRGFLKDAFDLPLRLICKAVAREILVRPFPKRGRGWTI